jgi:sec-independent protein translocase protein TatA
MAAMPFGVGQWELLVLGLVVLLIFGSAKLPRMGRDLGRSVRELKRTVEDVDPRQSLRELEAPKEPDGAGPTDEPRSTDRA